MPGPYLNTGIFKTPVTANDVVQQEELGVWRFEAGKILRYVQANPTKGSIQAGAIVKADSPIATAALIGNQVILTAAATDMVFGVCETTLAQGNFGWVTCFGPATAMVVTNTIPGMPLTPGTNTGVLSLASASNIVGYRPWALTLQTGLSAGSAVFVTVL